MVKQLRYLVAFFALAAMALATGPAAARSLTGVAFGDSLMAGYRLAPGEGFPEQLEAALRERGHDIAITNAGVSGDTTSGGLERIDWSVPDGTDVVILGLGGNDALRGIPPEITRANLDSMINRLKARGIAVILAGMLAPPNMGGDYAATFDRIYPDLAKTYGLSLDPFFLDGVITRPELMQDDGIHPTADGVGAMVDRFLPVIEPVLHELSADPG